MQRIKNIGALSFKLVVFIKLCGGKGRQTAIAGGAALHNRTDAYMKSQRLQQCA